MQKNDNYLFGVSSFGFGSSLGSVIVANVALIAWSMADVDDEKSC
jgi:hypothetical protein